MILWVSRVLDQGLKSESADIFYQSFLWLLRYTDEPQRGRNSCLWLQSRSGLSSFGVVLMSWRVNFHVVRSALQYSMVFCLQNLICLHPGRVFLEVIRWQVSSFQIKQAQVNFFFGIHMKYVVFMSLWPRAINISISNWPRTRKFSLLFQNTRREDNSHLHRRF